MTNTWVSSGTGRSGRSVLMYMSLWIIYRYLVVYNAGNAHSFQVSCVLAWYI